MHTKYTKLATFIRSLYPGIDPVLLHAPHFSGNEKEYLLNCIDTTYVSYIGKYVTMFENMTAEFTGARYAIALVNGTTALQVALQIAGVMPGDEVITQALTFVATANAISHSGAKPIFIDVDLETLGMSPNKLDKWLKENSEYDKKVKRTINHNTKRDISAIVPMHTFGHPCAIDEIVSIAEKYHIPVVEDSAESLGSYYKGKHTGTFGLAGILSYNGNKTITTGGGGMIITNDEAFARKARHITTTAKIPHRWEYVHDEIGYNYRLTNVSAAIGVAQMEKINDYLQCKRNIAESYKSFSDNNDIKFISEPNNSKSNYWLNSIILKDRKERDEFLDYSNNNKIMTRPIWRLMNELEMYRNCQLDDLSNSQYLSDRVVNLPSGINTQV